MKVIDILNAPWAIKKDKLAEIVEILRIRITGEKIDFDEIEARTGKSLDNEQERYTVTPDGVAVLSIEGVIGKKMNMFRRISGGASTQLIGKDFEEAMERRDVKAILFEIDSPGGMVDGTEELARKIYQARGKKPIATYVDGLMASAAAWIGLAADQVFISGEMAKTGSIGVVATHVDWSKWEEKVGIKTTEITAGKYKQIASEYAPLSQEGREYIQDMLDYIYAKFVNDVATFRGVSAEDALERMADGRIFIGSQAVSAGLVDGIKTKNEVIGMLVQQSKERRRQMDSELMAKMTLEELRSGRPDLARALIDEGKAEGAKAELERIKAVEALNIPGHEALIAQLKFDGKTTGPEAAVQVLQAEQANQKKNLKTLETEAPNPAPLSAEIPEKKLKAKTPEEMWDDDSEEGKKLRADFGNKKEGYLRYLADLDKGKLKVISKK